MNVLFRDTMTVYNYRKNKDSGEETWHRTVIRGVQWRHNRRELVSSNNVQELSVAERITIDFGHNYGNARYISPDQFRQIQDTEIGNCWTLDASHGMDILVLGISEYEIGTDCKLSELSRLFQYAATVTAVSDNRNMPRLKHIKVVAK
jgi:hypothetical protein